ncbi:MAG: methyltransferase domain-containing protein [Acidobacteria bacterium]|uniref:Methyltransferase domain-containing protein n=1 Tax=Candidatus Polarisedimenticola svalbardensis TaxID=2886004 RepID=A0A8J6Y5L0_9BACT|nr:methyltransferase domain-containing protein [Candidatus Polarisedimenticola svalbardensis]
MKRFTDANRTMWDARVPAHKKSEFYDVESFKGGAPALKPLELKELGDVKGKSLLHLQCHFGQDSLDWARRGAKVTGIDFSPRAIDTAKSLAQEMNLPATFVESDIDSLPDNLGGSFDIVFTSYGVVMWLPDIRRWGEVVAHFLKPGGTFYIVEFHPTSWIFDEESEILKVKYPYFNDGEPLALPSTGSYADPDGSTGTFTEYSWCHSLADVLNALINAGLKLEYVHEFPYTSYPQFPNLMNLQDDGTYRLKEGDGSVPLMYSIRAVKPV